MTYIQAKFGNVATVKYFLNIVHYIVNIAETVSGQISISCSAMNSIKHDEVRNIYGRKGIKYSEG